MHVPLRGGGIKRLQMRMRVHMHGRVVVIIVRVAMIMARMIVMIVAVIVAMFVMIMIVVRMLRLGMLMLSVRAGVSAGLGFKRSFNVNDLCAKPAQHVLDHAIPTNAKLGAVDLDRQMTIAEVPGQPHDVMRIATTNLAELLRRGNDLNQSAIIEQKPIAMTQRHGVREIEQKRHSAHACHRQTATMAVNMIKHNAVSRVLMPMAGRKYGCGADHG